MRIVSGILKGRQIQSPATSKTRPTTDKLRSALFSILGDMENYPDMLDAFAGTGAVGIEAYSRGAKKVDFIDKDITALKINTSLMEKGSFTVKKGDFLKLAPSLNSQYDLIFIDPPYNMYPTNEILNAVYNNNLLKDDGIIVFEEFYKTEFMSIDSLDLFDERKYGDTIVRFLRKK